VLIRSFDLLSPLLHAALRPPGHGVRVRAVAAALVGSLCDHHHRSGDASLSGEYRDLLEDDGLFRAVQLSCLDPTVLSPAPPSSAAVPGAGEGGPHSTEAAADLVEAAAAAMCLMSTHARRRTPEELDAVLVLMESAPARRCGVVKLLAAALWWGRTGRHRTCGAGVNPHVSRVSDPVFTFSLPRSFTLKPIS